MARRIIDWSLAQRLSLLLFVAGAAVFLPILAWVVGPRGPRDPALRANLGIATATGLAVIVIVGLLSIRGLRGKVRALESAARALAQGDAAGAQLAAEAAGPEPRRDELMRAVHSLAVTADLLQRREHDLSESTRLSAALASSLEPARIAEQGLQPIAALSGAQGGAVFVLDAETSALQELASWTSPDTAAVDGASRVSAQALRERTPLLVRTLGSDEHEPRSLLAIPMVLQDRPMGVLCLGRLGDFEVEAVRFAEVAARSLGLSLQNALLHRRVERLALELQGANDSLQERNDLLEERAEQVHEQNEALKRQARELELADRRKTELLGAVAHELRNPLAAIANGLRLIDEGTSSPEVRGRIEGVIRRQVAVLSRLVEDLLDASRIDRGDFELRRRAVDLSEIARHAAEVAAPAMRYKRHALQVELPEGPLWLEGDPVRLEQILGNLLHNAAKYTDEGGHVRLTLAREGNELVARIADDGIGLSSEALPRVFDLFMQVDPDADRSEGGLGIGLALVRKFVELHGGKVAARSEGLGRGCEFEVRLPAGEAPAQRERAPAPLPARAVRGLRILLLEDDPDMGESMAELLTGWGHAVEVFREPRPAIEAAVASPPDVLITDIGLEGMDGYAVARELRARLPSSARTRLAALTGYCQPSDRRKAREAGFDLHLSKPVDFDALRTALEQAGDSASPEAVVLA